MKPIAMKCSKEQWNSVRGKLVGMHTFNVTDWINQYYYLCNNYRSVLGELVNLSEACKLLNNRTVFETWDEDTFLEYCDIKTSKTTTMKTKITAAELLELHSIACDGWKTKFIEYFQRLDRQQNISFMTEEVDTMFKAATAAQKPVLEKIFGKQQEPIDFSKLKTGSRVMIQYTGYHCNGINKIDIKRPVDIVFIKSKALITSGNLFKAGNCVANYTTFHQDGKFVLFEHDENVITQVISY